VDSLDQVKKLREEYERALDAAESRRTAYHEAVLDLYQAGTPLREIAKELGLSHQRVHQIVSGEPPRRRKLPRAAGGIGAALVLVAATFGALRIAHAPPFLQAVPAGQEAAACLRGHGWSVAQHSSGVIVATHGFYRLVYQPSRRTGPIVQTGWSGYGPHGKVVTGEDETKIVIDIAASACFQQYTRSIHSFASPSQ
jgi:transcriptional regulator with XRE-family HTH domain